MGIRQSKKDQATIKKTEEELKREFALRLRRLRESAGQTQSYVSKALGFASESVYQLWEKEDGNLPSALNLRKLAAHFKVSADYLLGLAEEQRHESRPEVEQEGNWSVPAHLQLLQLALQGKDWDDPVVTTLLREHLRRSLSGRKEEDYQECYQRLLTDATFPIPPNNLPELEVFSTDAARAIGERIETYFQNRPANLARQIKMYVLDLSQVRSERLQRILLGMQGAELLKQRQQERKQQQGKFKLAVSGGRMVRNLLMAPNLKRGDVEDTVVIPLTLGRSQYDETAATTLIGNFVFSHGDYGVRLGKPEEFPIDIKEINAVFMGLGSLNREPQESSFARLLRERKISTEDLKARGVLGNVLYRLIRKSVVGEGWEEYQLEGDTIVVDIEAQASDDLLRVAGLSMLRRLVEERRADVVVLANEPVRVGMIQAALEMQWANAVICTLDVAKQLWRLLLDE